MPLHGEVFGISFAGQVSKLVVGGSVNNASDIGPVNGACAHCTWLPGAVQSAFPQEFLTVVQSGKAGETGLGVIDMTERAVSEKYSVAVRAHESASKRAFALGHGKALDLETGLNAGGLLVWSGEWGSGRKDGRHGDRLFRDKDMLMYVCSGCAREGFM